MRVIVCFLSLAVAVESFTITTKFLSQAGLLCHHAKKAAHDDDASKRRRFLSQVLGSVGILLSAPDIAKSNTIPDMPKYTLNSPKKKLGGLAGKIRNIAGIMVCFFDALSCSAMFLFLTQFYTFQ